MPEMEPITREETYYARAAGDNITVPEPVTHKEHFLHALATGETGNMPEPVTREEHFIGAAAENGGGSSVTVVSKSITANGTYTAPSGKAYSPVTVNVPDPYTLTTKSITANGNYDSPANTAWTRAEVNVQPNLTTISIDRNQTFTPWSGIDGFNRVVVNVNKLDPERIDGTVAVPFSMAVATEIHSKCGNVEPTAAATINVPITGMGALPCVVLSGGGDGTNTVRVLICGAAMPTDATNYGMVTLMYFLDDESIDPDTSESIITPLDNVMLVNKRVSRINTSGGSTSVTDLSALVPISATTVTFISRYEHGQTTQPDE